MIIQERTQNFTHIFSEKFHSNFSKNFTPIFHEKSHWIFFLEHKFFFHFLGNYTRHFESRFLAKTAQTFLSLKIVFNYNCKMNKLFIYFLKSELSMGKIVEIFLKHTSGITA